MFDKIRQTAKVPNLDVKRTLPWLLYLVFISVLKETAFGIVVVASAIAVLYVRSARSTAPNETSRP